MFDRGSMLFFLVVELSTVARSVGFGVKETQKRFLNKDPQNTNGRGSAHVPILLGRLQHFLAKGH